MISMVSKVIEKPATYEDLLKVPEHLVAEIVDGELFTSPRPASRHANATGMLFVALVRRLQRGEGCPAEWWFLLEPELHLGPDVLVPDIAGWRKEHMPRVPDVAWFDLAPDWICEVVSVRTARLDRIRKLPRYAGHGVPHAWFVDPVAESVEVYRRQGEHMLLLSTHEGHEPLRAEPFESCELDLSDLWLEA
jgi:Uma2 family endonuclease